MAKTFRDWVPEQSTLLPASVLDWIDPGHLVHFVMALVREQLDLAGILKTYDEARGYPPFDPRMMVALLMYAYSQGIYSSRRIAKACQERIDFMALTARQEPDFRTIALFRLRHLETMKGLFVQVLKLCGKAGLVKLGHVALDGTKIRANASKHKSMSYGRMKKAEKGLEGEIEDWFAKAEVVDREEDEQYGHDRRGDELPDWVKDKQKRLEKIRQAKAELEAEAKAAKAAPDPKKTRHEKKPTGVPDDKAQRNFTDPESRIMKGSECFIQAYNAQAAVDADSQIIVAEQLTANGSDMHQLAPMLDQIRKNNGRQAKEASIDAGYCCERNGKEFSRRRIRGYMASRWQKKNVAGSTDRKPPDKVQGYVRAMWRRLRQGGHRSRYRLRKQVVEPVFGQIKHARGFRQFLLRGVKKVAGEWSLLCTVHNLLKLAAVAG